MNTNCTASDGQAEAVRTIAGGWNRSNVIRVPLNHATRHVDMPTLEWQGWLNRASLANRVACRDPSTKNLAALLRVSMEAPQW